VPKIEIDEAEYNRMHALAVVANRIVQNPAARRRLEEAHKMVEPNAPTPFLDQERAREEPLNTLKAEMQAKLDAIQKERDDERRDASIRALADKQEKAFAKLKHTHRYTDEGVKAVRELMEAKGLLDVDDAVAIFERSNPPQMPATPAGGMTGQSWGFADTSDQTDALIKELIANKGEGNTVDRLANQALQDFRAGR
jgi:hypothetical protein